MSKIKPIKIVFKIIVWIVRGVPLMLQLVIIFYLPGMVFDYPIFTELEKTIGIKNSGRFIASVVAFTINYACYFSEIYRGGIESIPKGQTEAGLVLGMTKGQIFKNVVLMQVVKRILAPMSNEVITLVKDTALANFIGITEIILTAKEFLAKSLIWPLFYTGAFYLIFIGVLTLLFGYLEKKLSYYKV
jgi:polar amino acid transport system permease protein